MCVVVLCGRVIVCVYTQGMEASMETTYDRTTSVPRFGLMNNGATCWFNALIQALISSPDFVAAIQQSNETDGLRATFREFLNSVTTPVANVKPVLDGLLAKAGSGIMMGRQDDAIAGFDFLVDALGDEIKNVFKSRWRVDIFCGKCRKLVSNTIDDMYRLTVEQKFETLEGKTNELQEFIAGHMSQFNGYKCPACNETVIGAKVTRLVEPPKVLVISYNKYMEKWKSGPRLAAIKTRGREYRLQAIVQHYGTMGGGHYRAAAARDGVVYTFDDTSVTPGGFATTLEDYVLIYGLWAKP